MICCLGLFAGLLVGEYLGVGPILGPVGFILGLIADMKVFNFFRKPSTLRKNAEEDNVQTTRIPGCCAPVAPHGSGEQARSLAQKRDKRV